MYYIYVCICERKNELFVHRKIARLVYTKDIYTHKHLYICILLTHTHIYKLANMMLYVYFTH